jgi:hypothetical protein
VRHGWRERAAFSVLIAVTGHAEARAQAPTAALPRPPRWVLGIGVQEAWDSRGLTDAIAGAGRLATRLNGSLTHARSGRRGELTIGGRGSGWLYQGGSQRARLTHDLSVAAGTRLGSRLRLSVSEVLRSDYTDEDPLLLDEGTVLRRVSSRTNSAQAGLSYTLSARSELSGSVRHEVWRFDSDDLIGRSRLGVLAGIRRQVKRSGGLVLDYLGELRTAEGQNGQAHRLSLGWYHAWRGRTGVSASAGAQRLERLDTASSHLEPYGAAGAWWRGRAGSAALRYEHGMAQSYRSIREQRSDTVALSLSRSLGRRLSTSLASTWSLRQALEGTGREDSRMQRHSAAVAFDTGKGLSLGVEYAYLDGTDEIVESRRQRHRVAASLSYGHRWR